MLRAHFPALCAMLFGAGLISAQETIRIGEYASLTGKVEPYQGTNSGTRCR